MLNSGVVMKDLYLSDWQEFGDPPKDTFYFWRRVYSDMEIKVVSLSVDRPSDEPEFAEPAGYNLKRHYCQYEITSLPYDPNWDKRWKKTTIAWARVEGWSKQEDGMQNLDEIFQSYKLTEVGMDKAKKIAEQFNALLVSLSEVVPAGREMSIVKTKLEEACFFAKKGMSKVNAAKE